MQYLCGMFVSTGRVIPFLYTPESRRKTVYKSHFEWSPHCQVIWKKEGMHWQAILTSDLSYSLTYGLALEFPSQVCFDICSCICSDMYSSIRFWCKSGKCCDMCFYIFSPVSRQCSGSYCKMCSEVSSDICSDSCFALFSVFWHLFCKSLAYALTLALTCFVTSVLPFVLASPCSGCKIRSGICSEHAPWHLFWHVFWHMWRHSLAQWSCFAHSLTKGPDMFWHLFLHVMHHSRASRHIPAPGRPANLTRYYLCDTTNEYGIKKAESRDPTTEEERFRLCPEERLPLALPTRPDISY